MKVRNVLQLGIPVLAVLALGVFVPSASATVVGQLTFANCGTDGVTVTFSTVDFLPVGGGNGCIITGAGTNITFSGAPGAITSGETGTVNDLGFGAPFSGNAGFISFLGVAFNLDPTSPGPGVVNTVCSATLNPNNPACSVVTNSPFILAPTATGTSISLSVRGLATDATSSNSPWFGVFSTQIAGVTPAALQTTILAPGGSITSTFSFAGSSSLQPEPVSMVLIGGGLIALAALKRRKSRA